MIASSAWLDLRMRGESWDTTRGHDLVTRDLGLRFVKAYLAATKPEVADQILHQDLNLTPPLLIQMGGDEGPLSDALSYAAQARAAGVRVQVEIFAAIPHNFIKFASPISDEAYRRMGDWSRTIG